MKLPKELRKKPKINANVKKEQIYAVFRRKFDRLNTTYEPRFFVNYLKMGQSGKYSEMVFQTLGGYGNLAGKHFLLMVKEYENIEFYVNWERLGNIYLKGKLFYDLENHFTFFKNLYQQMAYHEYGHTFLIFSSSTLFYPTESIKFLERNNIRYVNNIPKDKITEFRSITENSKQNRINQNLKNISFMDIANGVAECHANYSMRNVLKLKDPIEFLKFSKVDLLDGLHDYSKFDVKKLSNDYINRRINNWVIKANDLFIYDKWDTMKNPCEKYGFTSVFNFAYDLNRKYLQIVNDNNELESMKDEILSLATEINNLDFKEMFFQ